MNDMNEKQNLGDGDMRSLGDLVVTNPKGGNREDGPNTNFAPKHANQPPGLKDEIFIIAPHPDDEVIGCYEILKKHNPIIIYTARDIPNDRREQARKLRDHFDIKGQFFLSTIPSNFLHNSNMFFFPHPVYETHFEHRMQGMVGEQLLRAGNPNIYFYITEMNAPFKFEADSEKKEMLDKCYPDQASMWKYEHKYFLFSGYDKWVTNLDFL